MCPQILGQLGNRIQHALRAYTPRDQKAVRTAAETFVANPKVDTAAAVPARLGEALVSTLRTGACRCRSSAAEARAPDGRHAAEAPRRASPIGGKSTRR